MHRKHTDLFKEAQDDVPSAHFLILRIQMDQEDVKTKALAAVQTGYNNRARGSSSLAGMAQMLARH